MPQNKSISHLLVISFIAIIVYCTNIYAGDTTLNFVRKDDNNPLRLTLVIDQAEKIAGMKVVVSFNPNTLVLKTAEKSEETSSFLHVVNDSVPGRVVFVMASATGVSGKDLALCHFEFSRVNHTKQQNDIISVTQIEIMSEDLNNINSNHPSFTLR